MWTVARVKNELPDVQVKTLTGVLTCRVAGSKNKFASVYAPSTGHTWEYSWDAVCRALNTGKPLRV